MNFELAADRVITDLARLDPTATHRALDLAVSAWPALADANPNTAWDLFGSYVLAAVEALHLSLENGLAATGSLNAASAGRLVAVVRALVDRLEKPARPSDADMTEPLARIAAAQHLRRAVAAVT